MKKFFLLLLPLTFALSCDYISNPIQGDGGNGQDSLKVMRNILIDDFTGHRCVNCPEAAEMIHTLQTNPQFEGRVVGLAIHTGFFAQPAAAPFDADYRTQEGDDLGTFFGITASTPFPTGMVNRKDYPSSNLKNVSDWPTTAASYLNKESIVDIQADVTYNGGNNSVTVATDLTWLRDTSGASFHIVSVISENHITGTQLTHSGVETEYSFEHMFRKTVNGTVGDVVGNVNIVAGEEETHSWTTSLDPTWKVGDLHVVIYVYDDATQEIMQVIEKSLN